MPEARSQRKAFAQRLASGLWLLVSGLLFFSCSGEHKKSFSERKNSKLPYLVAEPDTLDANGDTIFHRIASYTLTDQNGEPFGPDQLKGKIYVAEFFFASCKGICPIMTGQVQRVQDAFRGNKRVAILSHTVDPVRDTVAALAAFAKEHNAENGQWYFLTGEAKSIYRVARQNYKLPEPFADVKGPEDFFHSSQVALIDSERYIRGYYDATNPKEIDKLVKDITILLSETPQ